MNADMPEDRLINSMLGEFKMVLLNLLANICDHVVVNRLYQGI